MAEGTQAQAARRREERLRQKYILEMVIGMASALPQRPPGPLDVLPFRKLVRQQ